LSTPKCKKEQLFTIITAYQGLTMGGPGPVLYSPLIARVSGHYDKTIERYNPRYKHCLNDIPTNPIQNDTFISPKINAIMPTIKTRSAHTDHTI